MDIFGRYFESTDGYQLLWPVLAVPILAVIPLVRHMAQLEARASSGTATRRGRLSPKPQSWSA